VNGQVLYPFSDSVNTDETSFISDGLLEIHTTGRTGYSVLFVNAFRRTTSPPVSIASITKNPVRQRRFGLDRMFLRLLARS